MPVQIRQNVCSCDLRSPQTQPLFSRQRPNAETRHRRPCDDTDAVYHRAGVRRILAVAERTVRKWIRASVRTAYGFESEWRTHGRTRQHSSSGCVWALGRWRFLFPADHRPLHFALCAIPLELDLFTANSVLQMDRAGRPAVTAVAWSSKSNRRFRHRATKQSVLGVHRERSHEAAGCGDSNALRSPQLPPRVWISRIVVWSESHAWYAATIVEHFITMCGESRQDRCPLFSAAPGMEDLPARQSRSAQVSGEVRES